MTEAMKMWAAGLVVLMLAGCGSPLSNEAIIKEAETCFAADLKIKVYRSGFEQKIYAIQCVPVEALKIKP